MKSPQSGDGACRDTLPPEGMVREKAQEFIQQIMEEEVTELLGREKAERRSAHSWRAVPHNHLHHSFIGSSKITQDRSTVDICAARAATPSRLHSHFFPVRIDLFHDRNCYTLSIRRPLPNGYYADRKWPNSRYRDGQVYHPTLLSRLCVGS